MKIAVLGTGMVGRAIAGRLPSLGHDGRRRHPRPAGHPGPHRARRHGQPAVRRLARRPPAGSRSPPSPTPPRAAELVVNATSGHGALARASSSLAGADNLAGKVARSTSPTRSTSPQGFPPTLFVKDTDSLGEQIQRAFPDAQVVKTLNTLTADAHGRPAARSATSRTVFVSGDDAAAKATVDRAADELRAHRRHRPRRHQHRPRHRDAAAGLAAADGRARHRRCSTSRSSADIDRRADDRPDGRPDRAGHRRDRRDRRWPRPPGSPVSAPASGSSGATAARAEAAARAAARRRRRGRRLRRRPLVPGARCARSASEVLAAYPRLDVLVNNVGGYWATRHETADGLERTFARQPPRPVPAHPPAARPAAGERPGARRHGLVRRAGHGPDRLRRPAGRAGLQRAAGLQPVQARQRHVHLRAGPPARGHRGHGERAAPRRGPHGLRRRRTPAAGCGCMLPLVRPFMKSPDGARTPRSCSPRRRSWSTSPAGTSRTARPSGRHGPSYDTAVAARLWRVSAELVGLEPSEVA